MHGSAPSVVKLSIYVSIIILGVYTGVHSPIEGDESAPVVNRDIRIY